MFISPLILTAKTKKKYVILHVDSLLVLENSAGNTLKLSKFWDIDISVKSPQPYYVNGTL